ncbi:hypothetical protein C7C46_10025 [Streptomyces tateyamensis]|uniref:HTH luxR-type domain-containing protein n=1 Tax=Streptomyces tateyamensis TaxID=565073 RepID=A0A2V4PCF6_9ACTN|nr:hypothetical protein C7C46_10025 [Streptomyces tateyamensis]
MFSEDSHLGACISTDRGRRSPAVTGPWQAERGAWLPPRDPMEFAPHIGAIASALTPRELEVFLGLASGGSNRQLATNMGISERTVKAHIAQIMRKFKMCNRTRICIMSYIFQISLS